MAARLNDIGVQPRKILAPGAVAGRVYSSILVRHHHGDGGLRVVNIQRAACGNQFDETGTLVVVADIERDRYAVNTWAAADDSETKHPDNIPKASGFVLAGHAFRHGDVSIKNGAGEENGEADSGFLRGFCHVHLHAVGDGLCAGVGKYNFRFQIG